MSFGRGRRLRGRGPPPRPTPPQRLIQTERLGKPLLFIFRLWDNGQCRGINVNVLCGDFAGAVLQTPVCSFDGPRAHASGENQPPAFLKQNAARSATGLVQNAARGAASVMPRRRLRTEVHAVIVLEGGPSDFRRKIPQPDRAGVSFLEKSPQA